MLFVWLYAVYSSPCCAFQSILYVPVYVVCSSPCCTLQHMLCSPVHVMRFSLCCAFQSTLYDPEFQSNLCVPVKTVFHSRLCWNEMGDVDPLTVNNTHQHFPLSVPSLTTKAFILRECKSGKHYLHFSLYNKWNILEKYQAMIQFPLKYRLSLSLAPPSFSSTSFHSSSVQSSNSISPDCSSTLTNSDGVLSTHPSPLPSHPHSHSAQFTSKLSPPVRTLQHSLMKLMDF